MSASVLASCIMPTANRGRFVAGAVAQFLAQDYGASELVVLDDGDEPVADLIPNHPSIHYLRTAPHRSLGAKRNAACEAARGDVILHWDDDDWYAPDRIRLQVEALRASGADVCGINRALLIDPRVRAAWEYVYPAGGAPWVYGATLCYRREFWRAHPFADTDIGEDTRFAALALPERLHVLRDNRFFVALVHAGNTSPKHTRDPRWRPTDFTAVRALTGPDWPPPEHAPSVGSRSAGAALVTAAAGIGDILRVTPLIRALHQLGHQVDVLLAPDNPETADLLRGAPEIRELFVTACTVNNRAPPSVPARLTGRRYALATFTHWSAPLARTIDAKRTLHFQQGDWLVRGDSAGVETIARQAGWAGKMPEPFAMDSGRDFALPPGTVALHPGCKPDWPWKKWHGFAELARRFEHVALLGGPADLDNNGTYFPRPFEWPEHVHDYIGRLPLTDTAALIRQCSAMVANDSGLMHLAVALGVPSFGIFGITSPEREAIPSSKMTAITKGLPCEPACRRQAWGRRDCDHHIECLKMLTPDDVADTIFRTLPAVPARPIVHPPPVAIHVAYYGAVFDASGYGAAARAYIHAMHAAGIRLSVIDTGARPPRVEDQLVTSLLATGSNADFHLFHGVPPHWARHAYSQHNVIAMTVWETDTMPGTWRNPLTHAIDVWLPCQFNVDVFGRALGRQPFRLPHPIPSRNKIGTPVLDLARLGIDQNDFVFYSCFEWQDRKNPGGSLRAFLRAFPGETDAVLLLKTNPAAAAVAERMLQEVRQQEGATGRVVLCCEAWEESRIAALRERGDCYVSLHKGEGWGYPLFEAACAGKPVIATAWSGPLDYLDQRHHWLVRHMTTPVHQVYAYYHSTMYWAEPDLNHAAEGMRWVHGHRAEAAANARAWAETLQADYAPLKVGEAAKARLMQLKASAAGVRDVTPPLPIPGTWYDADYFETGVKSNWDKGYSWPLFKGVFEDTAAYLAEILPDARSFLDIGCAKGFLVRTLRQRGLEASGFDHSPWALQRADPAARPFLMPGDVETISIDRQFDVLVAMSIFESLTEAQAMAFLMRARAWTKQALFAVIATPLDNRRSPAPLERDRSKITLRDRAWWLDRMRQAGWRQDALHRAFERMAQNHPVPSRMGWSVFVVSPECEMPHDE